MKRRWISTICCSIGLLGATPPLHGEPPNTPIITGSAKPNWGFDGSDLKPDPAITYGMLKNGLRYALMRNTTPKGQVSLIMQIGSGAFSEHDSERGFAHFVEHMAFRGSKNVPDGEAMKLTERHGLRMGPDTNAFTTQGQTFYKFNFPEAKQDALDTGLMLFRETASRLNFDAAAVDAERGVILSEERLQNDGMKRARRARAAFLGPGQLLASRDPIGDVDQLKSARPDQLRAFYDANYRPSNAMIIIVGEIDVGKAEKNIKARFDDWVDPRPVRAPDLGLVAIRKTEVRLFKEPSASEGLDISWIRPAKTGPSDRPYIAQIRNDFLALSILNQRLKNQTETPDAPFFNAFALKFSNDLSNDMTNLYIGTRQSHWRRSLNAVLSQLRTLLRDGPNEQEINTVIANARRNTLNGVSSAATRDSGALALQIMAMANEKIVMGSPQQVNALFEEDADKITKGTLHAALLRTFEGSGPLVFRSTADPLATEQELRDGLDKAFDVPITAYVEAATKPWPYTSFGPAGELVSRDKVIDLDYTRIRFSNGSRLTFKQTNFAANQLSILVSFGKGRLGLSTTPPPGVWLLGQGLGAYLEGGLGKLTQTEINQTLAGKSVTIAANFGINSSTFISTTRPEDFEHQMQVLAAFASDPAYRLDGTSRQIKIASSTYHEIGKTPDLVFGINAGKLLVGNDPRFSTLPSLQDIMATKPEAMIPIVKEELASAAFDITIVGDIPIERAITIVANTFGAFPARAQIDRDALSKAAQVKAVPARAQPYVYLHTGRKDQAIAAAFWQIQNPTNQVDENRKAEVFAAILKARLYDKLRSSMGLVYAPEARFNRSASLPSNGLLEVKGNVAPEKIDIFFESVTAIIDDIARNGISVADFSRAVQPILEGRTARLRNNLFWLSILNETLWNPQIDENIRTSLSAFKAFKPTDIQRFAAEMVSGKLPLKIVVKPVATPNVAQTTPKPSAP